MVAPSRRPLAKPAARPSSRAQSNRAPAASGRQAALSAYQQGKARLQNELNRQKARKAERDAMGDIPNRFFLKRGTNTTVIICDEEPTFFRYEHNYAGTDSKYKNLFVECIQETDICPVCQALPDSRPYYGMFLTVIDLTSYESGGVVVPFSRKLLVIKSNQQEKFQRKVDAHMQNYGTLRGAVVDVYRSNSETSPASGDDFEFVDYEDIDTQEAQDDYVRLWKDRSGKEHCELLTECVDYEDVYPSPTVEELEDMFGVEPPVGSDRANARMGSARMPAPEPAPARLGSRRPDAARAQAHSARQGANTPPPSSRRSGGQSAGGRARPDSADNAPWEGKAPARPTASRPAPAPSQSGRSSRQRPTRG